MKENSEVTKKSKKSLIIIFSIIGIIVIGIIVFFIFLNNRCPNGYEYLNDRCTKIVTLSPQVDKYCPEGYLLSNDTCTKTETTKPSVKYYCDNTYNVDNNIVMSKSTLNGTICSYTVTHEPAKRRTCLKGAEPYSDTKCRITFILDAASRVDILTGKKMYYCSSAEADLKGDKCYIYGYSDYIYENICVDGFKLKNGKCVKTHTYNANWNATCPNDFLFVDKSTCTKTTYTDIRYNYLCPSDYILVGNICQKEIYLEK